MKTFVWWGCVFQGFVKSMCLELCPILFAARKMLPYHPLNGLESRLKMLVPPVNAGCVWKAAKVCLREAKKSQAKLNT